MKKKLLSLTAVAIVTIGVAAYAIGYEKFKINVHLIHREQQIDQLLKAK